MCAAGLSHYSCEALRQGCWPPVGQARRQASTGDGVLGHTAHPLTSDLGMTVGAPSSRAVSGTPCTCWHQIRPRSWCKLGNVFWRCHDSQDHSGGWETPRVTGVQTRSGSATGLQMERTIPAPPPSSRGVPGGPTSPCLTKSLGESESLPDHAGQRRQDSRHQDSLQRPHPGCRAARGPHSGEGAHASQAADQSCWRRLPGRRLAAHSSEGCCSILRHRWRPPVGPPAEGTPDWISALNNAGCRHKRHMFTSKTLNSRCRGNFTTDSEPHSAVLLWLLVSKGRTLRCGRPYHKGQLPGHLLSPHSHRGRTNG